MNVHPYMNVGLRSGVDSPIVSLKNVFISSCNFIPIEVTLKKIICSVCLEQWHS